MLFRSETLRSLPSPVAQDAVRATYAAKLTKEEALIDWEESAIEISRRVRAYNPFPGAAATLNGERIKLWRAAVTDHQPLEPGTVCNSAPGELIIACGQGALKVLELQRAGGKRLPTATLLKGFPIPRGACFSTPGGEPPA